MSTAADLPAVTSRPAAGPRLRKTASDAAVLTRRSLLHMRREPSEPVIALTVPIMMVLLFGYVFGNAMAVPGDDYREFLIPGVFVMAAIYGLGGVGTGVAMDADKMVMARFRSMPMAAWALLLGRGASDLLRAVAEIALLVGCGLLVGWTFHNGIGNALLAVGVLLLFRTAMICLGIYLGLAAPHPDAVPMMVYPAAFPLSVVSTAFLPPALMPGWLGPVAEWNPVSSVVSALRELSGNPGIAEGSSWIAQNPLPMAVVWPLAIIAICLPLAARRFRRLSR